MLFPLNSSDPIFNNATFTTSSGNTALCKADPIKLKSIKFEPIYQGQLINFITDSRVGTLKPPYYKELKNNEIFGIDFDIFQNNLIHISSS